MIEHMENTITETAKIEKAMEIPELADCVPCIAFMIKNNVKLEQETFIV